MLIHTVKPPHDQPLGLLKRAQGLNLRSWREPRLSPQQQQQRWRRRPRHTHTIEIHWFIFVELRASSYNLPSSSHHITSRPINSLLSSQHHWRRSATKAGETHWGRERRGERGREGEEISRRATNSRAYASGLGAWPPQWRVTPQTLRTYCDCCCNAHFHLCRSIEREKHHVSHFSSTTLPLPPCLPQSNPGSIIIWINLSRIQTQGSGMGGRKKTCSLSGCLLLCLNKPSFRISIPFTITCYKF